MGITHLSGLEVAGVPTMGMGGLPPFTGNWYFVNPASGSDGNTGSADSPFATLYQAYAKCTAGNNDVVVLVGNGATTGTARLSVALASAIDATATTGTLTWAKNATHLIGLTAPTFNARARIAPPTGTYTAATFGNSGNMVNVTATGCYFSNFSIYGGFSTGATGEITWIDAGGENFYWGVSFLGLNDAASAADTASRSLKISGSTGENTFVNCAIGGDTTTRSVANYSLEVTGGSPRNKFVNCQFPMITSSSSACAITVGASGIDRWALFDNCTFLNAIYSSGTTATDVLNSNAAMGGTVLFKNCTSAGFTGWASDTTQVLIDGGGPSANATISMTGKAVTPSA